MPVPMPYTDASIDTNDLAVQTANINITSTSWLDSSVLVDKVKNLKDLCLGNCRLLYGSERFKFYDVVIYEDETTKQFCALLTCNMGSHTKILRTETNQCAVGAVRGLVERLQRDTGRLFLKYNTGSQIEGQQGFTDSKTGEFVLWDTAGDRRIAGPDDDTAGLVRSWSGAPGGRGGARGYKRRAAEMPERERGVLRYDEEL